MKLHHEIAGPPDAPPLLLGSVLGGTVEMWEPQMPALTQTRRVIRFDHRGHGGSPVPPGPYSMSDLGGDVLELLDELEIERAAYCGLSMGAMVGLWLAIHAPDRIERLVLIAVSAHVPPPELWHQRAKTVREAGTPAAIADGVVARWFTRPYATEHPDVVEHYRDMIAATPAEGYASCSEAIAGYDERAGLKKVSAPTLVLAGAHDPSIPPDHGQTVSFSIPGARFELFDPGAHLVSVERADVVTRAMLSGV